MISCWVLLHLSLDLLQIVKLQKKKKKSQMLLMGSLPNLVMLTRPHCAPSGVSFISILEFRIGRLTSSQRSSSYFGVVRNRVTCSASSLLFLFGAKKQSLINYNSQIFCLFVCFFALEIKVCFDCCYITKCLLWKSYVRWCCCCSASNAEVWNLGSEHALLWVLNGQGCSLEW